MTWQRDSVNPLLKVIAAIPLLVAGCGGGSSSGPTAPTAPAPTLSAIAPASGSLAGQTVVRITGSGFVANPTVTFDGVAAINVQLVDAGSITASVPARATAGAVDVLVSNPGGGSGRLTGGYTYARYDGLWTGTTSQGRQVQFTVSTDQVVTQFSAGYAYGACSGSATFFGLSSRISARTGAAPGTADGFGTGGSAGSGAVIVFGDMQSATTASGRLEISQPGCGASAPTWTATKG